MFRVNRSLMPALGALWTLLFACLIVWLYAAAPASVGDAVTQARDAVRVASGTYSVDAARFQAGIELFRREQFAAARDEWLAADPARRDPRVQFYIAYSFYREGWGRLYNDDELFAKSLEALDRVDALAGADTFPVADVDLKLRTPAELRAELRAGVERTWGDFNPLKALRERK